MFRVRWEPTSRTCGACSGEGKYIPTYSKTEAACHACDGKGTVHLAEVAAKQGKVRAKLMGLLKKGDFEPVGADGEFELWGRKVRVESLPLKRARRSQTAPVLFASMRFSEMAAAVALAADLFTGGR